MKLYKIGFSKINNRGLFAKKDIKKGTKIINYIFQETMLESNHYIILLMTKD